MHKETEEAQPALIQLHVPASDTMRQTSKRDS